MSKDNCLICDRIKLILEKENPYFVCEMETGYVVIGDHQFFPGYTLFLCKKHKQELHELEPDFRKEFLWEMSQVAEAVYLAYRPQKLNYELLGNSDPHLHWHIFPRYNNDLELENPIWSIDKNVRCAESTRPSLPEMERIKTILYARLHHIMKRKEPPRQKPREPIR